MQTVYYIKWQSNGRAYTSSPINSRWLAESWLEYLKVKYPSLNHWIDAVQR